MSCRKGCKGFFTLNMDYAFKNKKVIVTGAGQGIGRELVKTLIKCGAIVHAVSKTKAHLDSLQNEVSSFEEISDNKVVLKCYVVNLGDWSSTQEVIKSIGSVDCLVNNAAVALLKEFGNITEEEIDVSFGVNVKSIINVSQIVAKGMIEENEGGSIVNVSSQASMAALQDHVVYCGTKAAVDAVTRGMALELGPKNIRVNSVNPTVVMTNMGRIGWADPKKAGPMKSKIPLNRFAEVEEVVNTILFLLSEKSSMITGVSLPVDGGFLAC